MIETAMFNDVNLIVLSQIDSALAEEQAEKLGDYAMYKANFCLSQSYSCDFLDYGAENDIA